MANLRPDYLVVAKEIEQAALDFNEATGPYARLDLIATEVFRFIGRDIETNKGKVEGNDTSSILTDSESLLILAATIATFPSFRDRKFRRGIRRMKKHVVKGRSLGSVNAISKPDPAITFTISEFRSGDNVQSERELDSLQISYQSNTIAVRFDEWTKILPQAQLALYLLNLPAELDTMRFKSEMSRLSV